MAEENKNSETPSARDEAKRLLDELSAGNADASIREQLAKALGEGEGAIPDAEKVLDANPVIAKALEGVVAMVRAELERIRAEVLGEVQNLAKSVQADNEVLMQGLAAVAPLLKSVKATVEEAQGNLEEIKKLRQGKVSLTTLPTELAKSQAGAGAGAGAGDFPARLQQYAQANNLPALEVRRLENLHHMGAFGSLPEALR